MNEITGKIESSLKVQKAPTVVTEENPGHFIVTSGGKSSEIFIAPTGMLSDGNAIDGIEVELESEKQKIIRERFAKFQTNEASGGTAKGMILKASMPGMVRTISVAVGDKVQKNTQVLILEAMKMENSISAGFAGIVAKINVEAGVSVEKNMPLMEFRAGE